MKLLRDGQVKTSQLYIDFFPNFTKKMSQCYWTSDNWSSVRELVSVNESTSVREPISINYQCATEPHSCENNRSSFSVFGGSTRATFNVKTEQLPRERSMELEGRIWSAGWTSRLLTYNHTHKRL